MSYIDPSQHIIEAARKKGFIVSDIRKNLGYRFKYTHEEYPGIENVFEGNGDEVDDFINMGSKRAAMLRNHFLSTAAIQKITLAFKELTYQTNYKMIYVSGKTDGDDDYFAFIVNFKIDLAVDGSCETHVKLNVQEIFENGPIEFKKLLAIRIQQKIKCIRNGLDNFDKTPNLLLYSNLPGGEND